MEDMGLRARHGAVVMFCWLHRVRSDVYSCVVAYMSWRRDVMGTWLSVKRRSRVTACVSCSDKRSQSEVTREYVYGI
jgi:hypothetical protein